jgi:competence protein ComEA
LDAAERRKLIALMLLAGLLLALSLWRQEIRLAAGEVPRAAPVGVQEALRRQLLTVQVSGAVTKPGLYQLPPGARVSAAVEAAGGLLPEADRDKVNLARPCQDGMHIQAPYKKAPVGAPRRPAPAARRETVNINSADAGQLLTLPGVGAELARRIIIYREAYGPFRSPQQLKDVDGIGEAKYSRLKDLIEI